MPSKCALEITRRSERFALGVLKCTNCVIDESGLIREHVGIRVPEGVFIDPNDEDRNVTVEVKRIPGGSIPRGYGGRTHVARRENGRERIIWPFTGTVENAVGKLNYVIASRYNVKEHHAVFLLPSSMSLSAKQRATNHIHKVAFRFLNEHDTPTKVHIHVVEASDELFDRLIG